MTPERIGVFGGTFDPPHLGHVRVAVEAANQCNLDRIIWVPAAQSPHKTAQNSTPPAVRTELVKSILSIDERFECSTSEVDRGGISYTVDTLRTLRLEYPDAALFLLMGEDSFSGFHTWKSPDVIAELATLVVYPRQLSGTTDGGHIPAIRLEMPEVVISSTEVRERVRRRLAIDDYVPEQIAAKISALRLYQSAAIGGSGSPKLLRDRVSQLIFPRIGSYLNPVRFADDQQAEMADLLDRYPFGGLVLFNGSAETTPAVLSHLQDACRFPLLIAADMERGVGQQLRGGTVFPHAMAYGCDAAFREPSRDGTTSADTVLLDETVLLDDNALNDQNGAIESRIRTAAAMQAREALNAGIHITFAPVVDVHSNPDNPIISTRSFGSTPSDVSRRITAYIDGCASEGILTTSKHFPGHGDTNTDSHAATPIVEKSLDELDQVELPPFRAAIRAGTDLIMTSHVQFPSLDGTGAIATESAPILTDLLRDELGFQGVVISDSLLMDGAGGSLTGRRAAALLESGVDILLDVPNPCELIDELVELVTAGDLDTSIVDRAVERIWALKSKLISRHGAALFSDPASTVPVSSADRESFRAHADQIGIEACRLSASFEDVTKKGASDQAICVVHVGPDRHFDDPTLEPLGDLFSTRFDSVRVYDLPRSKATSPEFKELSGDIIEQAHSAGRLVILVTAKPAAWQKFGLSLEQKELVHTLLDIPGSILVFSGLPVSDVESERATHRLCLYSDSAPSIRSLVHVLAGMNGRAE